MQTRINERKRSSPPSLLLTSVQLIDKFYAIWLIFRRQVRPRDIVSMAFSFSYRLFIFNIARWLIFSLFLLHLLSCLVYARKRERHIWSAFTKDFFFGDHIFRWIELSAHMLTLSRNVPDTPGINFEDENDSLHIHLHASADRKLTKKNTTSQRMNVLEFVSITCQAGNAGASMDCFRLSLELHPSHSHGCV
jgi:hypothetical protein